MYRYILANVKTKMPILHTDDIVHILYKYTILAKTNGHPYRKNNNKEYIGADDENIINFLNGGGYYVYEDYLIVDTHNTKFFSRVAYKGDDEDMSFDELLDYIKANIRNINIDKIID